MKMKNNKGLVLASSIFVMALLSIVSLTVLTLSLSQTKQAVRQDRRTQAFYLAKSGADSVAKYILQNPTDAANVIAKVNSDVNSHFSNGTFEVEILSGAVAGQNIIKGTGTVDGVENSVSVVIEKLDGAFLIDKAIYSNAPLDITGMNVTGDVQSGGSIQYSTNGSNAFFGDAEPNSLRVIEIAWPAAPPFYSPPSIEVKNQEMTLNSSNSFINIDVAQNGILNINAGSGIIRIMVDDLVIDNILNISATTGGRVELYINNTMTVTTQGIINNTTPEYLFIFLADGSHFYIQANMVLNGYIIGPNATVEFQSAQSTTNGAVIANVVQKNENGQGPNGAVNYVALPDGFNIGDVVNEYSVVQWQN